MTEHNNFQEARALMFRALELPPEARTAFVRQAAPTDDVAQLVLELLAETDESLEPLAKSSREPDAVQLTIPGHRILGVLGSGGMGTVYQAEQRSSGLEVAVKVLRSGLSTSHQNRFQRECATLQQLNHPNIARFLESGWIEKEGLRVPFFAMELVDGQDLRQYLRDRSPTQEGIVQIFITLADALHHAHEQGVVHRDLKPENILVDRRGQPRIVDFGIAHTTDFDKNVTTIQSDIGQILGTLQYMSPEQVSAGTDHPGPASDIYSLGMIAYEALGGHLPYNIREHSIPESVAMIHTATTPSLHKRSKEFPKDLDLILQTMLQKNLDKRYVDAADVRDDLGRFLRGERVKAHQNKRQPARRWTLAIAALIIGALGIAWGVQQFGGGPSQATASDRQLIFEHVEELDRRRHKDVLVDDEIRNLIDLGEAILLDIAVVPDWRSGKQLKRYVLWRLGELHFFLASRHLDYAEFDNNTRMWFDASRIVFRKSDVNKLQCSHGLKESIQAVPNFRPASGLGMTYMQRAAFREPLSHARQSLVYRRSSWKMLAKKHGYQLDSNVVHADPAPDLGLQLNELGETLTSVGYLSANVDTLNLGLRCLLREYRQVYLKDNPSARGSLLHNLSRAYYWRSQLRNDRDDLLLSIAAADSALQVRTRATGLGGFARTERHKAKALLALSVMDGGWQGETRQNIILGIRTSLRELEPRANVVEIALQRATLGRLLMSQATEQTDLQVALEANELTASARELVSDDHFSYQRSLLALDHAYSQTALYEITHDKQFHDQASAMLREAARLTARSQHVPLHQEINRLKQTLALATARADHSN